MAILLKSFFRNAWSQRLIEALRNWTAKSLDDDATSTTLLEEYPGTRGEPTYATNFALANICVLSRTRPYKSRGVKGTCIGIPMSRQHAVGFRRNHAMRAVGRSRGRFIPKTLYKVVILQPSSELYQHRTVK
eukprot:2514285-Rhodomonas_salina.1